ncbi:septal ring factor EnvC (AmiA/AmiB activator) [Planifilum fimeticola]|uniref:Septal ring factor EnvC (AmiA/AmiB activator) n=1 Tax=Planifilum fimeticola TaxID=201975 RepID=A0A2T0LGJ2_9BACL|nr:peptidoglycan DD-metalloendopeptidase family protein [Planifilum fimeticola]PRX41425.1 septal ring factor EnvC (AmiA/AmiB activator) [Planifilum fimeticola]
MRRTLHVALSFLLFLFAVLPAAFAETKASDIEEKKKEIKERDKQILQIEREKKLTLEEKRELMKQLNDMKSRLASLNEQVYRTEQKLNKSERRLQELEKRIAEREALLKNRLRFLYQRGEMYYLETLLDSDSFGDFLSRLDLVRKLIRADRRLLDAHKEDHKQAEAEKASIERDLKERKRLAAEAERLHKRLVKEYKQYEKQLADLEKKQEHLEEINERERKEVRRLIAQKMKEAAEKDKQQAEAKDGKFLWPVKGGIITSEYGYRRNPVTGAYKLHEGIDIGAPLGTAIRAVADGKVIESRPASGYGYIVVVDHGGGVSTLYAHVYPQDVTVSIGQSVSRGQVIAAVGNNGQSTGPHLHLEVIKDGRTVDPKPYFR